MVFKDYLTVSETAHILNCHKRTIYLWIEQGVIKVHKYTNDRATYIPLDEVKRVMGKETLLGENLYTTKDITEFLGRTSKNSVKDFCKYYIHSGKLKANKVRGKYLVSGRDLEAFFNKVYIGTEGV